MEKEFLLLHREIPGKIRSFQLKVFHGRKREICRLHFHRVKWTFPPCAFLYIFHGTTHPGHWRNKSAGARVGYERSNVCSTDRRVATKPNTSEPFYKVNTMSQPRFILVWMQQAISTRPTLLLSFELLSPLLVHNSWQCGTIVSGTLPCFPRKSYKWVSISLTREPSKAVKGRRILRISIKEKN